MGTLLNWERKIVLLSDIFLKFKHIKAKTVGDAYKKASDGIANQILNGSGD